MNLENPFQGMAYISEKGVHPENVLERYSILPLTHSMGHLNEQINSFCVGRNGVGKTMLLTLFDSVFQKFLYSNTDDSQLSKEQKQKILELVPEEVIGIYSNIDSPQIRLTQFQGELQTDIGWKKIFGDYYAHTLAKKLIDTLENLSKLEKWREHNKVAEFDENTLNLVSISYAARISTELPDAKNISSWDELKQYIDSRISNWITAVSKLGADTFSGPSETVQLITPLFYLLEELKNKGVIGEGCRLFIVIDQFETLYEHRKCIDFRPVFNLAMRQAARGDTRIEFKIGVRPYGYKDNLEILDSNTKLDLEKECTEIFIDELASIYYKDFIKDLTSKCLNKYTAYKEYADNVSSFFEKLSNVEEVGYYVSKSAKTDKHFSLFFNDIKGNIKKQDAVDIIKEYTKDIDQLNCKVYIETLMSIYAEKHLKQRGTNTESLKLELKERYIGLQVIFSKKCTLHIKSDEPVDLDTRTKEYYKYKDIESGALFIIAAAYKNKPKVYSGYDTLVIASSGVVLHYVEIVSDAFNMYLLSEESKKVGPLPATIQSDALYNRSNRYFDAIPDKVPHGNSVIQFLKNLGNLFRDIQLDTSLNKPYPNGFSLEENLLNKFEKNSTESDVITELLSYGFLEEDKHNDKNRLKGKRYKYYLNRLICPYFVIPLVHRKDPVYIYDNKNNFFRYLLQKDFTASELRKSLTTAKKSKVNTKKTELDSFP